MLKKILIGLGTLIALFLIVALFLPKTVTVSRSIVINKPAQEIYDKVADFNYYTKWNTWSQMEPTAKNTMSGTPKESGHSWTWEGDKVGAGSLVIEKVDPGKAIESRLTFLKPMEAVAKDLWTFAEAEGGTKVTWTYEGEMDYPIGRYFGLGMDGMLGPDFEKGLANIKKLCETE